MKKSFEKVLLIGVDAASWNLVLPLVKAGKLPNIKRLMANGVCGNLTTIDPTLSPVIWTCVATGKVKEKHGIDGFVTEIEGKEIPLTSNMRKAKAIWNILSAQGKSVSVVGWWNTWPAEQVNGTMISSYVKERIRLGKGYIYPDIPHQTYPPELIDEIRPLLQSGEKEGQEIFHRIFDGISESMLNPTLKRVLENIRLNCIRDETFTQISLYLQKSYAPDFLTVYLGGVDNVGHRFWKYMQPNALNFQVSRKEQEVFGSIIPNYYQYIDQAIGRLVDGCTKNTMIVIVSDHGMRATFSYGEDGNTGTHRGDDPGIFIISGTNIRVFRYNALINNFQNAMRVFMARHVERRIWLFYDAKWYRTIQLWQGNNHVASKKRLILGFMGNLLGKLGLLKHVSIFDIAPTVLYALGLDVAKDMDGRVITEIFTSEFLKSHPVSCTDSYEEEGMIDNQSAIESVVDEAIIERLKGLGYL